MVRRSLVTDRVLFAIVSSGRSLGFLVPHLLISFSMIGSCGLVAVCFGSALKPCPDLLDADKLGFLRLYSAKVNTVGRCMSTL